MKRSSSLPFTLLFGLGLVVVVAPRAHAQEGSRAQALFDEGRRLMNEGHYADACPKLAASQRLDPGAGTLMNLATCYDKNNQYASAWATFKDAAAAARAAGHPDWEAAARGRADQREPELAKLTVLVAKEAQVAGLVVERDGTRVDAAEWSTPIPIDAGTHTLRASAPGKKTWTTTVALNGPRAQATVTVPGFEIDPTAAATTTPATGSGGGEGPKPDDGSSRRTLGLVVGGAGLVGIGLGAVFGLAAKSSYDDGSSHCNAQKLCSQGDLDTIDSARTKATVSTIGFIAGGVLLAGGVVLYATAPRGDKRTGASRTRPVTGNMHVSVNGSGMLVGGTF